MLGFGFRGAAIRLVAAAGIRARDPVAAELVQVLVWSSKALRRFQSLNLSDREIVLRSAAGLLEWRDPVAYLAEVCDVSVDVAREVVTQVAAEAVIQGGSVSPPMVSASPGPVPTAA